MKQFLFVFLATFIINCLSGQALNKYGQITGNPSKYVSKNGAIGGTGLSGNGKVIPFTGSSNNALDMDGGNDYVSLPAGPYFNGNFTIECWIFPKSFPSYARIIDFSNGMGTNGIILAYTMGTTRIPYLHIEGTQFTANRAISLNQWTHIAATLSGNTATIYINGIAAGTATTPTPAKLTRNICYIGKSSWPDPNANALFDELRIWNMAKTEAEIQSTMNTELAGNEPGLVAYYNFNQGTAGGTNTVITSLFDKTVNGYDGTLNNFTLNGATSNWVNGAPINDGTSPSSASSSAYAIKQAFPSSPDGYYWIKNPNINGGAPFQIYADMTMDGGGWTLIMCNKSPNAGWTNANAVLRNQTNPTDNGNYSIIAWADFIKKSSTGFQYMMDANTRGNYGGIWTVNQPYSFVSKSNANTDITINTKFGNWNYLEGGGFGPRMPWWTTRTSEGIITTSQSGTSYWWGTLIASSGWDPSPWLSGDGGTLSMQGPGIIWYWVR